MFMKRNNTYYPFFFTLCISFAKHFCMCFPRFPEQLKDIKELLERWGAFVYFALHSLLKSNYKALVKCSFFSLSCWNRLGDCIYYCSKLMHVKTAALKKTLVLNSAVWFHIIELIIQWLLSEWYRRSLSELTVHAVCHRSTFLLTLTVFTTCTYPIFIDLHLANPLNVRYPSSSSECMHTAEQNQLGA